MELHPHPTHRLQAYISVAFELLKIQQNKLLSSPSYRKNNYKIIEFFSQKLSKLVFNSVLNEEELNKLIQRKYIIKAQSLQKREHWKGIIAAIPFDVNTRRDKLYQMKIKNNKIQYEKIFHTSFQFGKESSTTKYLAEKIEYDTEGYIKKIETFEPEDHFPTKKSLSDTINNKERSPSSTILYHYQNGRIIEKELSFSDLGPKSKVMYKYEEGKETLYFYEVEDTFEFVIEFIINPNKDIISYKKYDNDKQLIRDIERVFVDENNEIYNWIDRSNEFRYLKREVHTDFNGNIVLITDIDTKTKQKKSSQYLIDYDKKSQLIAQIITIGNNSEQKIKKEFVTIPFGPLGVSI